MANNRPEATFRLGNISASVFVSESQGNGRSKREFRTINLQRSYRQDDKTEFSSSFTAGDLPAAMRCLELAQRYVEEKEVLVDG